MTLGNIWGDAISFGTQLTWPISGSMVQTKIKIKITQTGENVFLIILQCMVLN